MTLNPTRWDKPDEPPNKVFIEKDLKRWGFRTELWVDRPGVHYKGRRQEAESLIWVLRGEARVRIGEEAVILSGGDRLAIPPKSVYALEVLGAQTLYWLLAFKKPPKGSAR